MCTILFLQNNDLDEYGYFQSGNTVLHQDNDSGRPVGVANCEKKIGNIILHLPSDIVKIMRISVNFHLLPVAYPHFFLSILCHCYRTLSLNSPISTFWEIL